MRAPPPPLRFLLAVLGGWTLARGTVLMWPEAGPQTAQAETGGAPRVRTAAASVEAARPSPVQAAEPLPAPRPKLGAPRGAAVAAARLPSAPQPSVALPLAPAHRLARSDGAPLAGAAPPPWPLPHPPTASASRWSLSAWAFVRPGGGASLAPGGMLGGSQAGARLGYRVSPAVAIAARLASPRRTAGAEAALGVDWRPSARLPVRLLGERRQKLGPEGRSAFALAAYGGFSDARLGRFRLDAYGQAGMVGAKSRDLFADGAARLSVPVGKRLKLGAGAWGAAQPGAARLDLGPSASLRLPAGERSLSLSLDWRMRVAGDARPGSGPALTLATDF